MSQALWNVGNWLIFLMSVLILYVEEKNIKNTLAIVAGVFAFRRDYSPKSLLNF